MSPDFDPGTLDPDDGGMDDAAFADEPMPDGEVFDPFQTPDGFDDTSAANPNHTLAIGNQYADLDHTDVSAIINSADVSAIINDPNASLHDLDAAINRGLSSGADIATDPKVSAEVDGTDAAPAELETVAAAINGPDISPADAETVAEAINGPNAISGPDAASIPESESVLAPDVRETTNADDRTQHPEQSSQAPTFPDGQGTADQPDSDTSQQQAETRVDPAKKLEDQQEAIKLAEATQRAHHDMIESIDRNW